MLVSIIFKFLLLSVALILSSALRWGRKGDFVHWAELPKPLLMSSRVYIPSTYHVTVWTLVFKDLVKHRRWVCPANMFPPLMLLFLKHTRLPAHLGQPCFLHRRTHTLSHTPEQTCLTSELTVGQPPDTSHSSAIEVKRRFVHIRTSYMWDSFFSVFIHWNSIFFFKPLTVLPLFFKV